MKVIAGDIGGTKSRLALMEVDPSLPAYNIIREHTFESRRFDSLAVVVNEFLQESKSKVASACFGVAGPVVDDECDTTNLPWHIRKSELAKNINISNTKLLNDFEAIGYGLEMLRSEDLDILQEGTRKEQGPIALLGAGTGLGEAFLIWESDRYRVHSSEGGHADFAPRTDTEIGLLKFLRQRDRHISYEHILSGPGIVRIYTFLVQSGSEPENPKTRDEMNEGDGAAVISRHALARTDKACTRTLDLFASIYGAEAGNLALKVLASGGTYLAGGISPRIIEKLRDGTFLGAFLAKGRLSSFVQAVPVYVIMNPKVGLLGAGLMAARS